VSNSKISALTSATTPLAGTEVLPIVQSSATVKVATNDLTVRNIRANATTGILQVTGPTAGTTRVATVPDANWTAARTDAAQSFTGDQTLSTGNLIIGTNGKGIDFSATPGTGTSELFADYEEGTWTPTLVASGGGASAVDFTGRYTKIGNVVYFNAYMNDSASNAFGTGSLTFGGLPYTCGSAAAQRGVVSILTRRITKPATSTQLVGWVNSSATTIALFWSGTDGNGLTTLNATDVSIASQVIFAISGFYQV
jgi:hypothetical protein